MKASNILAFDLLASDLLDRDPLFLFGEQNLIRSGVTCWDGRA
jgi:hypothetical protein